jgi:hypothetical protein
LENAIQIFERSAFVRDDVAEQGEVGRVPIIPIIRENLIWSCSRTRSGVARARALIFARLVRVAPRCQHPNKGDKRQPCDSPSRHRRSRSGGPA